MNDSKKDIVAIASESAKTLAAAATAAGPGHARGLAGALGCPPGVFCVIQ